jgi:hypothetical protein
VVLVHLFIYHCILDRQGCVASSFSPHPTPPVLFSQFPKFPIFPIFVSSKTALRIRYNPGKREREREREREKTKKEGF